MLAREYHTKSTKGESTDKDKHFGVLVQHRAGMFGVLDIMEDECP